jgi:hypothetical protein
VLDATFASPDLTTFCRLGELGLDVVGQQVNLDRAVLACRVVEPDRWCRRCGGEGTSRDTVTGQPSHEPLGWRPTTLLVRLCRYRCTGCGHVWRQDQQGRRPTGEAVAPRPAVGALEGIVVQTPHGRPRRPGARVSWNTANDMPASTRQQPWRNKHEQTSAQGNGQALGKVIADR